MFFVLNFVFILGKSYDNKIAQAIPPPPPYHASIQDSLTVRNAIQRNEINQITTQIQQSCSTNVFNVTATSNSTLTANISTTSNALYVNSSDSASKQCENNKNGNKQLTTIASEKDQHIQSDSSNGINANIASDKCENRSNNINNNSSNSNSNSNYHDSSSNESHEIQPNDNDNEQQNDSRLKNESFSATVTTATPTTSTTTNVEHLSEKRMKGLKVLSNVQVSPNTILNVSTLNSQMNDSISMNNMIIVGSIPSTSTCSTSQQISTAQIAGRTQSLLKNITEPNRNMKSLKISIEKSNVSHCFLCLKVECIDLILFALYRLHQQVQ